MVKVARCRQLSHIRDGMLHFCARRVAARACPRGVLAQALHSMPPKKTPTSEKETLVCLSGYWSAASTSAHTMLLWGRCLPQKGQRNIASFFKGPAGDKRPAPTSARKSSDAATSPANKALKVWCRRASTLTAHVAMICSADESWLGCSLLI